jgi:ankyrin repeat protein
MRGRAFLHDACYAGATEVAASILSNVPEQATELADTVSKHFLALAAMSNDEQIIKLLLENGPDLSAKKNIDNDNDPLKIAIDNAAAECAQILFSHLPNTGPAGFTPLMSAIHASWGTSLCCS